MDHARRRERARQHLHETPLNSPSRTYRRPKDTAAAFPPMPGDPRKGLVFLCRWHSSIGEAKPLKGVQELLCGFGHPGRPRARCYFSGEIATER